ncbi:longitudinals lacking protein, isoforms H/M/V-like [Odontomachus brunneus]|uniref:longitudinals lacking protein, isoforms H/M/V-like n=1 Tax=Odontomachus brunneus TaxID=486640 RepID=UPI0013F25D0C|nr:longitudinals lacking protein, isoforms H/M/V-like [Odontomachus brunneus]
MKEETVLSLKWQSFPSHLAVSLDTCYEKQQFVDLSLVCKDGTILKCHKMVLANSSTFFRRLLMANDHPHPMIILHDIEADDLKTIVNFMYCGEIQVVQSEVRRLLKLAEILEVTGLRHIQTSVMAGEMNHTTTSEGSRKPAAVSRLKLEEARNLPGRVSTESHAEINTRTQIKSAAQARFTAHPSSHSHKNIPKAIPQDNMAIRKNEEISINALNQRLETGNSGISIVDINDLPSTSKGLPQSCQKRKDPVDPAISWPSILSAISKDKPLPLKKLCIMDEVEITAGKSCAPLLASCAQDSKQNEPLDRRKVRNSSAFDHGMKYAVYIKDEVDILPDVEEDVDMDPLEIDEIDNDNSETSKAPTQMFHYARRTAR